MGIKILFTHPRSGSGLCGAILGIHADEGGFIGLPSNPKPADYILVRARRHEGLWTHYPYTDIMAAFLRNYTEFEPYVNLRDPRDIIVSYAHVVDKRPSYWWNYHHNGKRMTDYPFTERIDYLMDYMYSDLFRHDLWRQCGLCQPMYYHESVQHPIANSRLDNKVRGVVGAYQDEMTAKQIERATDMYRDLIEAWS